MLHFERTSSFLDSRLDVLNAYQPRLNSVKPIITADYENDQRVLKNIEIENGIFRRLAGPLDL